MNAKHTSVFTPGPWRVSGLLIKAVDHGKWFGIAKAGGSRLTIEGWKANARLIAAAPDLLKALQALLPLWDREDVADTWSAEFEAAQDAIAKAAQP